MGSIGQTPGATSVLEQKGPDAKPFTSGAEDGDLAPNLQQMVIQQKINNRRLQVLCLMEPRG